jgi:hypothetical protein
LLDLLAQLESKPDQYRFPETGKVSLALALEAAQLWGFSQTVVLVDTVDPLNPDPPAMFSLIQPFFRETDFWKAHQVYLKMFLSDKLETLLSEFLDESNLQQDYEYARIVWDKANLSQVIQKRLEAAGSHLTSLGALASEEAASQLERLLVDQSNPRDVLERIKIFFMKSQSIKNPAMPISRSGIFSVLKNSSSKGYEPSCLIERIP